MPQNGHGWSNGPTDPCTGEKRLFQALDGRTDGQPENIMPPAPKGGGIKRCDRQTDGQTERSVLGAAWSQLKPARYQIAPPPHPTPPPPPPKKKKKKEKKKNFYRCLFKKDLPQYLNNSAWIVCWLCWSYFVIIEFMRQHWFRMWAGNEQVRNNDLFLMHILHTIPICTCVQGQTERWTKAQVNSLAPGRSECDSNKANLRDLIAATGLIILLKFNPNCRFFSPCDLEISWMTSKNNRALHQALCIIANPWVN